LVQTFCAKTFFRYTFSSLNEFSTIDKTSCLSWSSDNVTDLKFPTTIMPVVPFFCNKINLKKLMCVLMLYGQIQR
ncbi:MAG: hypothetical protein ACJ72R_07685, partial [Nitrososphaeraceae archaeon]